MKRLSVLFSVLFVLTLSTIPTFGQDALQPGDPVIFTAESTSIYAYPDANSTVISVQPQGYVDRLGPAAANEGDWLFLIGKVGYVRAEDAGLALRTDTLQQQLLDEVNTALEQNPADYALLIRRGTIYAHMLNYEAAITDYTTAIEQAPENGLVYTLRGWVYRQMNRRDNAIADYEQAISLGVNDVSTMTELGATLERMERDEESRNWYQQAWELYPDTYRANNSMGNGYFAQRDYDQALDYYDQATAHNLYGDAAYYNRSLIAEERDDTDEAAAIMEAYLEINPYVPDAYVRLAAIYAFGLEEPFTALDYIDRALEIDPEYSEAYDERAVIYAYEIGNTPQALEDLRLAIAFDPYNDSALTRAGILHARIGEVDTALEYYKALEPMLGADESLYYVFRAQIYYMMEEYGPAQADLNQFLTSDFITNRSGIVTAYLFSGVMALQHENYALAAELYNIAFSTSPEWTRDFLQKPGMRLIDSRMNLIMTYSEAITADPDEPDNYLQLANVLMEFGAWDEALNYYRQYLTMVDNAELQGLVDTIQGYLSETD